MERCRALLQGTALFMALLFALAWPVSAAGAQTEARSLVPVGHTVGVKLFSRGVLVVKVNEGETPAHSGGVRTGDVIMACDGESVTSSEQFQTLLQQSGGSDTELQVTRGDERLTLHVEPVQNDAGIYCIGAWIRDSMAGIGTMTYYDPQDNSFGALGHGITDVDTAQLMPFSNGAVIASTVKAVKKGEAGSPGELRGDFDLTEDLGSLYANTANGIFGTLAQSADFGEPIPVGAARTGPAEIRANVEGDSVESFRVEILQTGLASDGRDMVISITDPALLAATGGIVQGMSGSPILQDGQLVGALTHVLLGDPTKGYGISMAHMLQAGES